MKILISFVGRLGLFLNTDLRWLGVIEAPNVHSKLAFRLLGWGDPQNELGVPMPEKLDPVLGGTGLASNGKCVISALQWHTPSFALFDKAMNYTVLPEALVEDIHSIAFRGDTLFATQTLRDQLIAFEFPNFEEREVIYDFGTGDNKHHLNSVTVAAWGEVLMAFHVDPLDFQTTARAIVVNLTKNELIDLPARVRRLHSLIGLDNGRIAFCDSMGHQIWTGEKFISTIGYPRGLALSGDFFISGSSRLEGGKPGLPGQCAVQIFHGESGECVNQIMIPDRWEIYDVLVLE